MCVNNYLPRVAISSATADIITRELLIEFWLPNHSATEPDDGYREHRNTVIKGTVCRYYQYHGCSTSVILSGR